VWKSNFEGFTPKDARKLSFLQMLFLKNKVEINKNNYGTMLFISKQVSLPKISSILQKIKISSKSDIRPL